MRSCLCDGLPQCNAPVHWYIRFLVLNVKLLAADVTARVLYLGLISLAATQSQVHRGPYLVTRASPCETRVSSKPERAEVERQLGRLPSLHSLCVRGKTWCALRGSGVAGGDGREDAAS